MDNTYFWQGFNSTQGTGCGEICLTTPSLPYSSTPPSRDPIPQNLLTCSRPLSFQVVWNTGYAMLCIMCSVKSPFFLLCFNSFDVIFFPSNLKSTSIKAVAWWPPPQRRGKMGAPKAPSILRGRQMPESLIHIKSRWDAPRGGNLSFQDTGLCHSNRKSTTHKSGEISQKYTHKSGEFSENHTHKSGNAKTAHQ